MTKYDLPLKIVHGFDYPDDADMSDIGKDIEKRLIALKNKGFGGIVTNVAFRDYMKNERLFKILGIALDTAKRLGLRVWLYDEKGYPSGAAGGLTLQADPDFECRGAVMIHKFVKPGERFCFEFPRGHEFALSAYTYKVDCEDITGLDADRYYKKYDVYGKKAGFEDVNDTDGLLFAAYFVKKRVYEGTHAEHNVFCSRRYVDITNPAAIAEFIKNTYAEYAGRYKDDFAGENRGNGLIEAIFTDEPSLMGIYINAGLYPPAVQDEYDDTLPLYPVISWGKNIENRMKTMYGCDVCKYLIYLFAADTGKARLFRRRWYREMSYLIEKAFFEQISDYCASVGLPFSGHILLEDDIRFHPCFEGNFFSLLRHMHYPGIDMLHSVPETVYGNGFTPKLVSSVAHAYGRAHVMSEVSAHAQGGKVTDMQMLTSQLLQFAFGVDVFTSYYSENMMEEEKYKKYNEAIGKTVSAMKGEPVINAALYYPIDTVSENTLINVEGLCKNGFSDARKNDCADRLNKTVKDLFDTQTGFDLIDLELLQKAEIKNSRLVLPSGVSYSSLIFPPCRLCEEEKEAIRAMTENGVKVFCAEDEVFGSPGLPGVTVFSKIPEIADKIRESSYEIINGGEGVAALEVKTGEDIRVLLVNSKNEKRDIRLNIPQNAKAYDPLNETEKTLNSDNGVTEISLPEYGFIILKY